MQKKPRLGQNFLVDADACRRVVAALGDIAHDAVLEIGPGHGAITRLLARRARHLTLVEFDPTLASELASEFAASPNVEIRHADVLTLDITALAQERGRKLTVVGNLPYYITSDILLHLLTHHAAIDRAVLMVQREVAERVAAPPGSSDHGVLSATMQLYGTVEMLFTLPPSAFAPPPEVHSSVLRFHVQPRFEELGITPARFVPFVRASFAQKRKTWANNLRNAGYNADAIAAALTAAALDRNVRAEAVDLPHMAAVFRALGNT
ncbi:MAG TPA: 16S rRNA (adenine(1518)-N(6)/adenine(1519)-N(6))-dimethyltransferase RsmA [Acidobacteriaceae bacterium]